jgi:phosphoribosylformylglycinamidine (FGAM) synthase PurS component
MKYSVEIIVMKRESVLDSESRAITNAFETLVFDGI